MGVCYLSFSRNAWFLFTWALKVLCYWYCTTKCIVGVPLCFHFWRTYLWAVFKDITMVLWESKKWTFLPLNNGKVELLWNCSVSLAKNSGVPVKTFGWTWDDLYYTSETMNSGIILASPVALVFYQWRTALYADVVSENSHEDSVGEGRGEGGTAGLRSASAPGAVLRVTSTWEVLLLCRASLEHLCSDRSVNGCTGTF